MSVRRLPTIDAIGALHLRAGCGVCTQLRHHEKDTMADVSAVERRPLATMPADSSIRGEAANTWLGRSLEHRASRLEGATFGGAWSPVLALYERWSMDSNARHRGTSGGVDTAIAAHAVATGTALEALNIHSRQDDALHVPRLQAPESLEMWSADAHGTHCCTPVVEPMSPWSVSRCDAAESRAHRPSTSLRTPGVARPVE